MDTKINKYVLVIVINYIIFIVVTIAFSQIVPLVIHSEKWLLFSLGIYTMVTGIWGQVLKMVLLLFPYVSFIYEKKIYIIVINYLIILIGLSMILISMVYYR